MTFAKLPSDFTLRASAPLASDLVADLVAYHQATDPENAYGFSTRELWEWRLEAYGYSRLFQDWLLVADGLKLVNRENGVTQ